MYYSVTGTYKPEILDKGSVYKETKNCSKCGRQSLLISPGVFFPSWKKKIGLFYSIGGIVGSDDSINHLKKNGVKNFKLEEVSVNFKDENSTGQKFYLLKPKKIVELDPKQGAGPGIVCAECKRRLWTNSMEVPCLPKGIESEFFQIKYTYIFIVNELFRKACLTVPDGCFLEFEEWHYKSE